MSSKINNQVNYSSGEGQIGINIDKLINECLKNDLLAQEKLYKLFFPKMMALVRRYTDDYDKAIDILNNGFLRVFKKLNTFKFEGSFEGLIRRIMINAVSDYFRYKSIQIECHPENIPEIIVNSDILDKYDYSDLINLLQQLPETSRIVFNFSIIEGYSYSEISEMLNISESTCRWHVGEARKLLKKILIKRVA